MKEIKVVETFRVNPQDFFVVCPKGQYHVPEAIASEIDFLPYIAAEVETCGHHHPAGYGDRHQSVVVIQGLDCIVDYIRYAVEVSSEKVGEEVDVYKVKGSDALRLIETANAVEGAEALSAAVSNGKKIDIEKLMGYFSRYDRELRLPEGEVKPSRVSWECPNFVREAVPSNTPQAGYKYAWELGGYILSSKCENLDISNVMLHVRKK